MLRLTRITSSIPSSSSHHALPSSLPISTLIPSSLPCLCTSTSSSTSPSTPTSTSFRTFATRVMPPKVAARPTLAQKFAKASGIPRPDALGRPTPEPSILPPVRYDHPYTNPRVTSTEFPITDEDVNKYLEQQKSIVKEATIKTRDDDETEKIHDPTPIVPLSFAIIDINNHQHKITAGDLLMIDRIDVPVGVSIVLHKVMLVGTQTYTIVGRPTIPGAEVHGTIEEHTFLSKTLVFHRKRRKNHRKWKGHRDRVTMLRIDSVVIPEVAPTATLPAPSLALPLQSPTMVHVRTKPIAPSVTEETQEQTA